MRSRKATLSLVIIIILLSIFIFRRWREPKQREAFDRTPGKLEYTKHAQCRMNCREISKKDINEIMSKGIINFSRSDRYDKPCPTYALQGVTSDGESLRIIFAQCSNETKVVTAYNLKEEFECNCPGDERKEK